MGLFGTWQGEEESDLCFPGAWCVVTSWMRPLGPTFGLVGVNSHRHKDIIRKISGCKPFLGRLSFDIIISQRCFLSKSASVASEMFWGLERLALPPLRACPAPAAPTEAWTQALFEVGSRCGGLETWCLTEAFGREVWGQGLAVMVSINKRT